MPSHYKSKSKKYGGKAKANNAINAATASPIGKKVQGPLKAKPGAKSTMSRSGAVKGKNPNAQTAKPKRSHTIKKATR